MTGSALMLAEGLFSSWIGPGSTMGEILLLVGIILLISLGFFLWATVMRDPRRHHSHRHHSGSDDHGGLPQQRRRRRSSFGRWFGRKHRRRMRRRERPVNPTLSQSGGLPPRREDPRH